MFARKQHNMLIGKPTAEAVTIRIGAIRGPRIQRSDATRPCGGADRGGHAR
jgi:actin-like ATPase involved in cell morphogenesis